MRESENGKKKWCLRFMKEDIRKRRTTINENVKTCATINVWHFGYPSASGKKERIGKTWNWKNIILQVIHLSRLLHFWAGKWVNCNVARRHPGPCLYSDR